MTRGGGVNSGVPPEVRPPSLQPRHRQVARIIVHWRSRCPGLPILLAKKDIAGAFRLLWLSPEDCELFGGEVPWNPSEMTEDDLLPLVEEEGDGEEEDVDLAGFVAVFLVLSFGFNGAPGEWSPWGMATKQYHESLRPAEECRDGPERFAGEIFVDDELLVEPLLGLRPWVSRDAYEQGVRRLLGEGAINADKDAVEGTSRRARRAGAWTSTPIRRRSGSRRGAF